jgi:hypothetical protein
VAQQEDGWLISEMGGSGGDSEEAIAKRRGIGQSRANNQEKKVAVQCTGRWAAKQRYVTVL